MPQTLQEFLDRQDKPIPDNPLSEPILNHRRDLEGRSPLVFRNHARPKRQIPSFKRLETQVAKNPRIHLRPALHLIFSELFEFEQINDVALLNPAVVDRNRFAREHLQYADMHWRLGEIEEGNDFALSAFYFQLTSLIEAYRVYAGYSIVEARAHIEHRSWAYIPKKIKALHKEARALFAEARKFEDHGEFDLARARFVESIIVIDLLYIESEHHRAMSHTVQGPVKVAFILGMIVLFGSLMFSAANELLYSLFSLVGN